MADGYMAGSLTAEQTRELLHAVSLEAEGLMRAEAEKLVAELAPADFAAFANPIRRFFKAAGKILRTAFLAAALVLNGPGVMDAETKEVFVQQVVAQEVYLKNFEAEVTNGSQAPGAELVNRAGMYGRAAYSVGENTNRGIMLGAGAVEGRRILGMEDDRNCEECPPLAELGWMPVKKIVPIGQTVCRVNCRCLIEYRDKNGKIVTRQKPAAFSKHKLRGRAAKDLKDRHGRARSSGHGYNPNRGPDGKFAAGPHHDERGVWRGRSDGPTLHAGTEQYVPSRQAGVALYARQTGQEHGQDVRIAFTPPKHAGERAKAESLRQKDRHLVESTVEPKYRVETHGESTRHVVGGESVAEVRRHENGKHWISRETMPSDPGVNFDYAYRSKVGAERRAAKVVRATIREETTRTHHAPRDVHDHFDKFSAEHDSGTADTHTIRHRIVTREG